MISAPVARDGATVLYGVVRGLESEVAPLVAAIDAFRPSAIALGIPEADAHAITEYFVGTSAEPLVPLTEQESAEAVALSRFGDVRVPHPAFRSLLEWGRDHDVPVVGADPADEEFAGLFTAHIGYVDLVRRTVSERRLRRSPPESSTPEGLVLAWDRALSKGHGSARFAEARDRATARVVTDLRTTHARVAAVVDRERFERMRLLFGAAPIARQER